MAQNKRLEMLEKVTASGEAEAFAWYALALEYAGLGRVDEALRAYTTLRVKQADYVPMYLMCGTMLVGASRPAEGREWLESGLLQAQSAGNDHALRELEEALNQVPPPPSVTSA